MNVEFVHVQWTGPYRYAEALRFDEWRRDHGVYQFCGLYTAYGPDALLYIGMAQKQTFGTRMKQRQGWEGWQETDGPVTVYLGRLHDATTPDDDTWDRQIALVEKLLILAHRPAHNSSGIYKNTDPALRAVHVLNWGDRGRLLPEVSGARWSSLFDNIEGYAPYGSHKGLAAFPLVDEEDGS